MTNLNMLPLDLGYCLLEKSVIYLSSSPVFKVFLANFHVFKIISNKHGRESRVGNRVCIRRFLGSLTTRSDSLSLGGDGGITRYHIVERRTGETGEGKKLVMSGRCLVLEDETVSVHRAHWRRIKGV